MKGGWNVSMDEEGGEGCRHEELKGGAPTAGDEGGARGEREQREFNAYQLQPSCD